ncbi:thioesterase family protein [Umezawaea beigongshangensis]|uniref:thioesterase family protein n=1 Tax=Umezawaea beigongshangensis TaxID=2780383 RepID=UPI0018F152F3|nr:thioesterase family protein [Umezawaea beigongshangensis]
MSGAFYLPVGDGVLRSTARTAGPWSERSQHLGPPSALLVRALERCAPREGTVLSRVAFDVLGPVPVAELTVRAEVLRPGRSVELLSAELAHEGRPVLRASAWRISGADTSEVATPAGPPLPPPRECGPMEIPPAWSGGYLGSVEWRSVSGGVFRPGDAVVWARASADLVEGEEMTPLQRLFSVVDSASGVSSRLDIGSWYVINTDLVVHLHRQPRGEWTALDASTAIGADGVGLATSTVHDASGPVGRSAQSLFVRERGPATP